MEKKLVYQWSLKISNFPRLLNWSAQENQVLVPSLTPLSLRNVNKSKQVEERKKLFGLK